MLRRCWEKLREIISALLLCKPKVSEEWNPGPAPDFVARLVPRVLREYVSEVPGEYREELARQVEAIQAITIDWTVVGFYAKFELDREKTPPMPDLALSSPLGVQIITDKPPLETPFFLLWFGDGIISSLEGFVCGERFPEMTPEEGTYFFEKETFEHNRNYNLYRNFT